jgi:hypothetical protein
MNGKILKIGNTIVGMTVLLGGPANNVRSSFYLFPFTFEITSFEIHEVTNYGLALAFFGYDINVNLGFYPARHYFRMILDEFRAGD